MSETDAGLAEIEATLRAYPNFERRCADVVRVTFDQIYHGQATGRYRWDQLAKTEKTHFGSLIEINLQREFKFNDGDKLDFEICSYDVDCKYSQKLAAWMIPTEAVGQYCLGLWASDAESVWSMGLFKADEAHLNRPNKDGKRQITASNREIIRWLFEQADLPENILLQLPNEQTMQILSHKHGAARVRELFRLVQRRIIPRGTIATVAQQEDYMKRVRYNGGARSSLQPEGILIFGHYTEHSDLAEQLGLTKPLNGEVIGARVIEDNSSPVEIDSRRWRLAEPSDPVQMAPRLPKVEKPKS